MSALAPTLQAFFTDRLAHQRHASPETVATYRDGLRLLICFAAQKVHKQPSQLDIADFDATLVALFLTAWSGSEGTVCAVPTPAWLPFTRSSAGPHFATPNTPS